MSVWLFRLFSFFPHYDRYWSNLTFWLWLYTKLTNFHQNRMNRSPVIVFTDKQTDRQIDKSDHNTPSQNLWRGKKCKYEKKKCQQEAFRVGTQTHPSLWPLTMTCDFDFISRWRKLMSIDVVYCVVPWFQVWCLWM